MKKLVYFVMIGIIGSLFFQLSTCADELDYSSTVSMANYWERKGRDVQKVTEVGTHIINANKLNKRIPIQVQRTPNVINASSTFWTKTVKISNGLLFYIDNDDELAYVLGHEMAHSIDAYDGILKWLVMIFNTREYEYKADLIGIDLMVKAGYNPVAAITCSNKWMGEEPLDLFTSHPTSSKRLIAMYKYIYVKYPWALKSDMVKNVNYQNFTYASQKDIDAFQQKYKLRSSRNAGDL